jgi:hypothetical protein
MTTATTGARGLTWPDATPPVGSPAGRARQRTTTNRLAARAADQSSARASQGTGLHGRPQLDEIAYLLAEQGVVGEARFEELPLADAQAPLRVGRHLLERRRLGLGGRQLVAEEASEMLPVLAHLVPPALPLIRLSLFTRRESS